MDEEDALAAGSLLNPSLPPRDVSIIPKIHHRGSRSVSEAKKTQPKALQREAGPAGRILREESLTEAAVLSFFEYLFSKGKASDTNWFILVCTPLEIFLYTYII